MLPHFYPLFWGILGAVGCGLLLMGRQRLGWATVLGLFLGFSVLGGLTLARWHWQVFQQAWLAYLPTTVETVYGRVVAYTPGAKSTRMDVVLDSLQVQGVTITARGKIRVRLPNDHRRWLPETPVILNRVELTHPSSPRNPGSFDYRFYLHTHGFVALARADSVYPAPGTSPGWTQPIAALRQFWLESISAYFPQPQSGFLRALLVGDRMQLDVNIRRSFQLTGMMHVLAISGLHVGLIGAFLFGVLKLLRVPIRWRYSGLVGILLVYTLLTGAQPPVVRATLMISLWALARLISRPSSALNLLFAAALILLLIQPYQLFWVGFQLSFAAVLFILVGMQWMDRQEWVKRWQAGKPWQRKLLRYGIYPMAVTLWAQLGTLPMIVTYFHIVSPIAVLLNLIVLPVITLLLYLGLVFLILVGLWKGGATLLAAGMQMLLKPLFQLVEMASQIPLGHWTVTAGGGVLFIISLGILAMAIVQRSRWRLIMGYGLVVILLGVHLMNRLQPPATEVIAIDVGQGDALMVRTPQRSTILVDTGPPYERGYRPINGIQNVLQTLAIRRVQRLLISHPHFDHMGNVRRLLQQIPVDSVYFPRLPFAYRWQDSLVHWLAVAGVPYRAVQAGDIIPVDASARLYVLAPLPRSPQVSEESIGGRTLNNHSLVARLWVAGGSILVPGDVERESEYQLMKWKEWLKADLLKVPHHGSSTSTVLPWLQWVAPQWSVISVGQNNRFNHPAPAVVRRLQQSGSRVLQTAREGAIWLRYQDNRWFQVHWRPVDRFCQAFWGGEENP